MANQAGAAQKISLGGGRKYDVRTQFAALCYRVIKGDVEICLITSRRSKRWIIPKGWPMDGQSPLQAAETEAWEEAGLTGKMHRESAGLFHYAKQLDDGDLPCIAIVYPMKVKKAHSRWPERKDRQRKWVSRKKAAGMLSDPELARLVQGFAP